MPLTEPVVTVITTLAVVGQLFLLAMALLFGLALVIKPLRPARDWLRRELSGGAIWLAFIVALLATAGSLFFSEYSNFLPCKFCWWQRYAMYPLVIILPIVALVKRRALTAATIVIPVIGAGIAVYHRWEELNPPKVDKCAEDGPSCVTNWLAGVAVFDYITIPTLALTAFLLIIFFLLLSVFKPGQKESLAGEEEFGEDETA